MKKYLLFAGFCIAALAGNAQIVSSTSRNITTTTVEKPKPEKKTYFGIDASVGNMMGDGGWRSCAFGLGLHWERHYNPYVAWDIVSLAWDAPFDSLGDPSRLSIKTGVRAFSPRFYRDMRAYANLDLGYTTSICKDYYGYEGNWDRRWYHGFGLEIGFGLRLTNHVGVGYALNWDSESEIKGNYFRVSVLF